MNQNFDKCMEMLLKQEGGSNPTTTLPSTFDLHTHWMSSVSA